MRSVIAAWFFLALLFVPSDGSRAGLDNEIPAVSTSPWQLVVVEAKGCIYCGIFRRDVLPAYETSEQGKEMPARFVDVNDIERNHLNFTLPVTVVPTFVVVKSSHEVGRISGYMGPEDFFHSIKYLLASAP